MIMAYSVIDCSPRLGLQILYFFLRILHFPELDSAAPWKTMAHILGIASLPANIPKQTFSEYLSYKLKNSTIQTKHSETTYV